MNTRLLVTEIINKSSAILHSDGLILFQKLIAAGTPDITLSFKGIEHCTTAFLNASIGNYVIGSSDKGAMLKFEGTTEDLINKIDLVLENARDQKKRDSYSRSTRGFLHA